jgi:PhnB protein
MPKEFQHRILHARLVFAGGGMLYAGDAPAHVPYEGIKGVTITLDYPTVAEAEEVFAALAEGGQVSMPMQPAFWAKRWGMLVDRFGTPWNINGEQIPF